MEGLTVIYTPAQTAAAGNLSAELIQLIRLHPDLYSTAGAETPESGPGVKVNKGERNLLHKSAGGIDQLLCND